MNYRHAFHAGNIADVFKHFVLVELLRALHKKPTAFCVVDTHAGAGQYRLAPGGEHEQGIGQLWPERDRWPALAAYFAAIESVVRSGRLKQYPGSPAFIRAYLRASDRAVLMELHPEEYRHLRTAFTGRHVQVLHVDAWQGLKGAVPPPENRGLVLIDPPYEKPNDWAQIITVLRWAAKHWRNGMYMVWYPIKAYPPVERFQQQIAALGLPALAVDFITLPVDVPGRLNGSGVVVLNPPWGLDETLQAVLPPLAARLAGVGGRPQVRLRVLNPEHA